MKSALLEVQKMMNVLKFQSDAGIGGFCAGPAFIRVMRQVEDTLARPAPEALGAAKGELSDAERWRTHIRLMREEGNSERGIRAYLEIS